MNLLLFLVKAACYVGAISYILEHSLGLSGQVSYGIALPIGIIAVAHEWRTELLRNHDKDHLQ